MKVLTVIVHSEEGFCPAFPFPLCLAGCLSKELSRVLIHDESIADYLRDGCVAEIVQIASTKTTFARWLSLATSTTAAGFECCLDKQRLRERASGDCGLSGLLRLQLDWSLCLI